MRAVLRADGPCHPRKRRGIDAKAPRIAQRKYRESIAKAPQKRHEAPRESTARKLGESSAKARREHRENMAEAQRKHRESTTNAPREPREYTAKWPPKRRECNVKGPRKPFMKAVHKSGSRPPRLRRSSGPYMCACVACSVSLGVCCVLHTVVRCACCV